MYVSIVILNYFHPEVIRVCLHTLQMTTGVDYEVIVVDNGSDAETIAYLEEHKAEGRIDKLILNSENKMFSEGNNIGVAAADPNSDAVLLLNSDVGFKNPEWLLKLTQWLDGTMVPRPNMWAFSPTIVKPGPFDIVSCGWSYDENLAGKARPEGWCCLFRKKAWVDMSPDFPYYYGFEEAVALSIRNKGSRCGVLWNYSSLLIHREQGSSTRRTSTYIHSMRAPDMLGWYKDLEVETLDFSHPGEPIEHSTYMEWD